MRVTITGARGSIGRQLVEELTATHDLRLIDRAPLPEHRTVIADLSRGVRLPRRRWSWWPFGRLPRWEKAFEGAEAVVHLAATANPRSPWPRVLRDNVQATWNVLDAAARHGTRRVVLASSCMWALGLEEETAPGWAEPRISSASPPSPRTAYGLSKAWGELAGRMFVESGRLPSVVVVRVGTFSAKEPPDKLQRRLWVRPADTRTLFRRCVEAEFDGFHIVHALSCEAAEGFDLRCERELLGWQPEGCR